MVNTTWKVTNNTTKISLVIINASVDSDAPQAFYYDQSTSLLPFSASNILAPGTSDTITVPDINKDKNGYSLPFTFIVANAITLAPLKALTFKADLSDIRELSIDDTTLSDIAAVFDFNKNITAFPASELATEFAAIDFSDEAAVNEFFAVHEDYKKVTLDALHLVRSYYNALPYGWTNGKDTTIYLYSGDYENVSDTEKVRSVGTIKITNDWTQPLPLSVPDIFSMQIKLNDDRSRKLLFKDGAFWDSANTSSAKVALAASFVIPSQLTLDDASNKICTSLTGTLNGKDAFGLEGVSPTDPDGNGGFLELFDVHSFKDGLTLAMYGIGIAVAIGLLVKLGQFIKWCKDYGNPTIDQKERAAQTEELKLQIDEKARLVVSKVNEMIGIPKPEDIPANQQAYSEQQLTSKTLQSIENVKKMLAAQTDQLAIVGDNFTTGDMQLLADNLGRVQLRIDRGTSPEALAQFRTDLKDTLDILSINNTSIFVAKTKINNLLVSEERVAYDRAFEAFDSTRRIQERIREEIEEIQAGDDELEIIDDEGAGPSEPIIER
ncbi:hypothetical protein DC498_11060 [Terrimonas sp.]|uniref:hypothetical protein n=1 Tax=Terrimonas sp. TaxID=1914338 RepID=UPI000D520C21|nr:hypothetical protein [Terrimonas sp.]PVD52255.1 hypothetical protein DC498_11060 [Terrimonas sp.]